MSVINLLWLGQVVQLPVPPFHQHIAVHANCPRDSRVVRQGGASRSRRLAIPSVHVTVASSAREPWRGRRADAASRYACGAAPAGEARATAAERAKSRGRNLGVHIGGAPKQDGLWQHSRFRV